MSDSGAAEAARIVNAYARRIKDDLYSLFDAAQLLSIQERERQTLSLLRQHGWADLLDKRILDLGCGSGTWIRDLVRWGAQPENLNGIDLLPGRIADARRLCPAGAHITCRNASELPYEDASFDLIIQSTVFSSILDPVVKQQVAKELMRVLKPGGLVLWYDFFVDNPKNPDVKGVRKKEIRQLLPGLSINAERITLLPPLARRIAMRSSLLYRCLSGLKILNTHYLAMLRKSV
jgi:ubiquinone/menaquinone biosynthesis C-methylase UbiE